MQNQQPMLAGSWVVYLLVKTGSEIQANGGRGDRSLYVGITNNMPKRIREHNSQKSSATKFATWALAAQMPCTKRAEAAVVEQWLKCGNSRAKRFDFYQSFGGEKQPLPDEVSLIIKRAQLWQAQRSLREGLFKNVSK